MRYHGTRALAALAGVSAVLGFWLVALGGLDALSSMLEALTFQLERGSLHSLWLGAGLSALQPVADAALAAALIASVLAVRRDPELRDDLQRMAALFAGLMLLAQFAANYWTWAYLPWALVPLLLSLLAPGRARAAS